MVSSRLEVDEEALELETGNQTNQTKPNDAASETSTSVSDGAEDDSPAKVGSSRRKILLLAGSLALLLVAGIVVSAVLLTKDAPSDNQVLNGPSPSVPTSEDKVPAYNGASKTTHKDEHPTMFNEAGITTRSQLGDAYDIEAPIETPLGDVTLQPLSKDVLKGYASLEEFNEGFSTLLKFAINEIILQNIEQHEANTNPVTWDDDDMVWEDDDPLSNFDETEAALINRGTNNQEEDADEGDVIKTDGKYVYFADGGELLVWNNQGAFVTRVDRTSCTFCPETCYSYCSNIGSVQAILTTSDHVVVVAYGYPSEYRNFNVLDDLNRTRVEVYTKPTSEKPEMKLVTAKSINGRYKDSLWLQESDSIHIVTYGSLNSYGLAEYLNIQNFPWMSKEEYLTAATSLATKRLIPKMAHTLSRELSAYDQLPHMLQFNTWTTTGNLSYTRYHHNLLSGILEAYMQVTSINAKTLPNDEVQEPLNVTTTVLMTPNGQAHTFYGSGRSLVLSVGTEWYDSESYQTHRNTTVFKLKVETEGDDVNAIFHSMTSLSGRLATEKYSLDIEGDDLRVATTTNNEMASWEEVREFCGYQTGYEQCMPDEAWVQCEAAVNSCDEVLKEGCPYSFTCADGSPIHPPSSIWNEIVVLDTSQEGDMTEIGRARIGEPEEIVFAVRFTQNFSYAVTFEQSDPFYVLDLQAGQAPVVTGSVKPDGFYTYLHPINDEHTMLVGVGQNTTLSWGNPSPTGFMISVFDATDPQNPTTVASHIVVDPDDGSSSSLVQHDTKAFQYIDGKLILPVSINHNRDSDQNFQGFIVFDVSAAASDGVIKELFRVTHANRYCYYCSSGGTHRAFQYDDDKIMTIGNHVVVASDLNTGSQLWNISTQDEEW